MPVTRMNTGYTFELPQAIAPDAWRKAHNDDWDTVVYTPDGTEVAQGELTIDGSPCTVFLCPDGLYRAQMTHYCRS